MEKDNNLPDKIEIDVNKPATNKVEPEKDLPPPPPEENKVI